MREFSILRCPDCGETRLESLDYRLLDGASLVSSAESLGVTVNGVDYRCTACNLAGFEELRQKFSVSLADLAG